MIILALDSTAVTASVAVCRDEKLLCESTLTVGNTHSETLLPMVEDSLRLAGLTVGDVDLFACSGGPGSFTGVRIGAATIKGLAFGRKKPCIGVSTLEALAYNLIGFEGIICPVMNARRSQVYNALFEGNTTDIKRLTPDRALSIAELENELKKEDRPIFLVGDGYDITRDGFSSLGVRNTPERLRYQSAFSVAMTARKEFLSGKVTDDRELVPTYLRLSQAERERIEKENNSRN